MKRNYLTSHSQKFGYSSNVQPNFLCLAVQFDSPGLVLADTAGVDSDSFFKILSCLAHFHIYIELLRCLMFFFFFLFQGIFP